jgi:hypothetical protein
MNWIKQLWEDTGDLSTRQLFFKYLLPLISIFFTWIFIGKFYLSQLGTNSLVANKGQVLDFNIRSEKVRDAWSKNNASHMEYPLKITLRDYDFDFRLRGKFMGDFIKVASQIPKGDTITIYTLSKLQSNLCGSSITDVYQIDKNGKTIFPIDGMKQYNLVRAIFPGLITIISLLLYFYYKKGRIT